MIWKIIWELCIMATALLPTQRYIIGNDNCFIIPYEWKGYATIIEKTYEGCLEGADDEYLADLNGTLITFVADDLLPGDTATVYFHNGEIIHVLYERR